MTNTVTTPSDAVLAILRAAVPLTWFDAHVPSSTTADPLPGRYGVVYPQTPVRKWADVAHVSDWHWIQWQITSVGTTRPEAEWIASHARDALVDVRLQVPGLMFEPVEHLESQPIRWDDQVPGRVVLYGTDQYGCNATVAPA